MQAYKLHVEVGVERRVAIDLPKDFPQGSAEVIVLAERVPAAARVEPSESAPGEGAAPAMADADFARLFPVDPALGKIVFHEDPTAPLSEEDWPEADDDAAP